MPASGRLDRVGYIARNSNGPCARKVPVHGRKWLFGWRDVSAAGAAVDVAPQKWVIEPVRVGVIARLAGAVGNRRILWFLAGRRIRRDRYEDTTLGKFWLFARPLMPIFISTVVFGNMLKVPSDGMPYFLFFLAGTPAGASSSVGAVGLPAASTRIAG